MKNHMQARPNTAKKIESIVKVSKRPVYPDDNREKSPLYCTLVPALAVSRAYYKKIYLSTYITFSSYIDKI